MVAGERTVRVTRSLPRSVRVSDPPLQLRARQTVSVVERSDEMAGLRSREDACRGMRMGARTVLGSGPALDPGATDLRYH